MESFEAHVRRVFFSTLVLILVPAGFLVLTGLDVLARGVALGGAASLINLVVMVLDIRRREGASRRQRVTVSVGSYGFRMGITAAALVFAAIDDDISLLATIPALFCVQLVFLFDGLIDWLDRSQRSS